MAGRCSFTHIVTFELNLMLAHNAFPIQTHLSIVKVASDDRNRLSFPRGWSRRVRIQIRMRGSIEVEEAAVAT